MKLIPLKHGKFAMVDDENFDELNKYKWYCSKRTKRANTEYAVRGVWLGKDKSMGKELMHRKILSITDRKIHADHIDHNGLNNQKSNLRTCTATENLRNKLSVKNGSSKYKGVYHHKKRNYWVSAIVVNKKSIQKIFQTELEAALHYNIMALKYFKEFANLNIITND